MNAATGDLELAPLSSDISAAVELSRSAIVAAFSRSGPSADAEPRIATVVQRIRAGEFAEGVLCRIEDRPVGVALWETGHPSGIVLQTFYLRPHLGRPEAYGAFLRRLLDRTGPAVFTPGGLVGLSDTEESALMHGLGFERFSRSEMRWPSALVPPPERALPGVRVRPVRPDDEPAVAALHLAAFDGTFDQFMYLSDPDPAVDAARAVHEMMSGRYGEFLDWASTVAEVADRPRGASLVVRAPYGPLLISVMVDRGAQGAGIGRELVIGNLHALRGRGETFAALNVTEGNARAVNLYEHLGFARSLGPEHSWYSRAAVPVAPGEVLSGPMRSLVGGTPGSAANRTPRT